MLDVSVNDVGLEGRSAGLGNRPVGPSKVNQRAVARIEPIHRGNGADQRYRTSKTAAVLRGLDHRSSGGDPPVHPEKKPGFLRSSLPYVASSIM